MEYLAHMTAKWGNSHISEIYIGPFKTYAEAEVVGKMERRIDYLAPADPTLSGSACIFIGGVHIGDIMLDTDLRYDSYNPSIRDACDMIDKALDKHFGVVEINDGKPEILTNPFGNIILGTMDKDCWYIMMPTCDNVLSCGHCMTNIHGGYICIGPFDNESYAINAAMNIPIDWIHETTVPGIVRGNETNVFGITDTRMGTVKLGTMRVGDNFFCGRHMTEEHANEVAAMMRAGSRVIKVSKDM